MQKVKLPKHIDPIKSATQRSEYGGVMASKDMPRWVESVEACAEDININVKFAKDAQGLTYFDGKLSTQCELICQRCNSPYSFDVNVAFCFSPVQGSEFESEELPETYEPVAVDEHGEVNLVQLFEDELIIAIPIVPVHAEDDCKASGKAMTFGVIDTEPQRENPFSVLQKLKRDQE